MPMDGLRKPFGHDVIKAYDALDATDKTLTPTEFAMLTKFNRIYTNKQLEYFEFTNALKGYKDLPAFGDLKALSKKLIGEGEVLHV